jgi:putative endonuclease
LYYTYVLLSEKDQKFYIGFTRDLERNLKEHQKGVIASTKDRRSLKLIYYEACLSQDDVHLSLPELTNIGKSFRTGQTISYDKSAKEGSSIKLRIEMDGSIYLPRNHSRDKLSEIFILTDRPAICSF